VTKLDNNKLSTEEFSDFKFVPLLGADGWAQN